jgi:AcrR family transcriptional regulator
VSPRVARSSTVATPSRERSFSNAKNEDLIGIRQVQIVEGALRVFVEKGFHASTIRDIALACGMSMGQLYHYVSSKDDILFLVHRHEAERQVVDMEQAIVGLTGARERLVAALEAAQELAVRKRKTLNFMLTESRHLDADHRRALLRTGKATTRKFWSRLLAEVDRETGLPCGVE